MQFFGGRFSALTSVRSWKPEDKVLKNLVYWVFAEHYEVLANRYEVIPKDDGVIPKDDGVIPKDDGVIPEHDKVFAKTKANIPAVNS